jgi:trehalose-phosphatase
LCLDYDGTLAAIASDPASAEPYRGAREQVERLSASSAKMSVAILTGRTLADLKRISALGSGLLLSGVHGLELNDPDGAPHFHEAALACTDELAVVRQWLTENVPAGRGFIIEDKRIALGLHYRHADKTEAAGLCEKIGAFVLHETPRLKLVWLKMLAEVMPRIASKGRALLMLKARMPASYATAYFGDDTTDEDAFAVLGPADAGILVGAERPSFAAYRVADPAAVVDELRGLGDAG